jgi:hypothetical protein
VLKKRVTFPFFPLHPPPSLGLGSGADERSREDEEKFGRRRRRREKTEDTMILLLQATGREEEGKEARGKAKLGDLGRERRIRKGRILG